MSSGRFLSDDALRELEPLLERCRSVLAGSAPVDAALARLLAAAPTGALARACAERLTRLRASPGRCWEGHDLLDAVNGRVSVFLLPAGGAIPLHDHPGMVVLMRVVLGRVRVTTLDWVDRRALLARPSGDRVLAPEDDVLEADRTGRNLHAVEALEPSAFIDVLTPDYAVDRPCTYFVETGAGAPEGLVRLRAAPAP